MKASIRTSRYRWPGNSEIRRRQPDLPIVVTTGYAEAASSMDIGEFGLVLKPYSAEALAAALRVDGK